MATPRKSKREDFGQASADLIGKEELRRRLNLPSVRMVEELMRKRKIPFIRLGHRTVRFS